MAKLSMKKYQESKTVPELFEGFIREREAIGVSPNTIKSHRAKFRTVCCFYARKPNN